MSAAITRRALLASAAALAGATVSAPALAARFSCRRLEPPPPLVTAVSWGPRRGKPELILALHGHQSQAAEATWLSWLHVQPSTAGLALLVPSLGDPARWGAPDTLAALTTQLDALPFTPRRTFLLGFSSGASYGFQVAAALADRGMELDAGVPPGALDASAAALVAAGVQVERYTFAGLGHSCPLERVAPVLAAWIARV